MPVASFSRSSLGLSLALSASLALVACGKPSTAPATGPGAAGDATSPAASASTGSANTGSASPAAAGAQAVSAKLNGYTGSYNKLIGTFGLTETAKSYQEENVARQSATDSISVTDGWIDQGVAALKKARALPGGPADLDASADALIAALDKVMARLAPLKIYYDSKAYKDDKLARGKQEDAPMRAEFTAALDALHAFDAQLTTARNRQDDADMAALKAKGDLLGYDTKSVLKQGEALIGAFHSDKDLRDAALIARTDGMVKTLEAALAEQRQAYADAKAKAKPGEPLDIGYEQVATYLTSMIGSYREMKQSHDVDDLNEMVKEYNNAIEAANGID